MSDLKPGVRFRNVATDQRTEGYWNGTVIKVAYRRVTFIFDSCAAPGRAAGYAGDRFTYGLDAPPFNMRVIIL